MEEAIKGYEVEVEGAGQGSLFGGFKPQQVKIGFEQAKATVLEKLEKFLGKHSGGDDLGIRLDGEQLATGVRFIRIVKEGTYDLVIGNPPYQGTAKMADAGRTLHAKITQEERTYMRAFIERGLELTRQGGMSALVTMRLDVSRPIRSTATNTAICPHDLNT